MGGRSKRKTAGSNGSIIANGPSVMLLEYLSPLRRYCFQAISAHIIWLCSQAVNHNGLKSLNPFRAKYLGPDICAKAREPSE
jgi:hypothetical protein